MSPNVTNSEPQSGYDIPVLGLEDGSFYYIHIPAICCIVVSFICALMTIILSFRKRGWINFCKSWSKGERFVVYLAICHGLLNVSHFMDHLHMAIARTMVYPKELCEFYGFNLTVFVGAQNLMVNIVAVNAFCLLYFKKNLNFGNKDWRLLLWTFGVPFIGATIAGILGQLGPSVAFCFFDAVNGFLALTVLVSIPLVVVLIVNITLYILTWTKIRQQIRATRKTLGSMSGNIQVAHRAARTMSLFMAAFIIQWGPTLIFGVWRLVTDNVPQALFYMVTTFSNIGGVLHLGVYLLMMKLQVSKGVSTVDKGKLQMTERSEKF